MQRRTVTSSVDTVVLQQSTHANMLTCCDKLMCLHTTSSEAGGCTEHLFRSGDSRLQLLRLCWDDDLIYIFRWTAPLKRWYPAAPKLQKVSWGLKLFVTVKLNPPVCSLHGYMSFTESVRCNDMRGIPRRHTMRENVWFNRTDCRSANDPEASWNRTVFCEHTRPGAANSLLVKSPHCV